MTPSLNVCTLSTSLTSRCHFTRRERFFFLRFNVRRYIETCVGLHEKWPIFFLDFNQNFFRQIFIIVSNIKFYGKPSIGSRVDTCEQTDGHYKGVRHFSTTMRSSLKRSLPNLRWVVISLTTVSISETV